MRATVNLPCVWGNTDSCDISRLGHAHSHGISLFNFDFCLSLFTLATLLSFG